MRENTKIVQSSMKAEKLFKVKQNILIVYFREYNIEYTLKYQISTVNIIKQNTFYNTFVELYFSGIIIILILHT